MPGNVFLGCPFSSIASDWMVVSKILTGSQLAAKCSRESLNKVSKLRGQHRLQRAEAEF